MAKPKKRHTIVRIAVRNHAADKESLGELKKLGESLAPFVLARIGATGKRSTVIADKRGSIAP